MEGLGGFTPFTANEEVATALILLCALFSYKSEVESHLGFRFQPTNEQIFQLLQKKRLDPHFSHRPIKDIDDICSLEPWDLPRESDTELEEPVWYLFCEPYYKYKESNRAHRRTNAGYWKVTGRGSKLKTRNGLTGSKKILTFYRHGPDSKKEKTEWVMHEFHLTDNASYKKEFVLCRIERKWNKKHGISTPDEGESSQQLVSPNKLLPSDLLVSNGNRIDKNTFTNLHQQLPNPNLFPYSQNRNNTLNPYSQNSIKQNTPTNLQLLPPNHDNEEHTTTNHLFLPNQNLETQVLPNQPLVIPNVAESTSPKEHLQHGEPNTCGASNGLNKSSFPAPQSPFYPEREFPSINCDDFFNFESYSEQVMDLTNMWACQDETLPNGTGQTLTPDFNSLKSAGGTYEDSSDKN